jgi:GNAT superfamily N-acetyltransferase
MLADVDPTVAAVAERVVEIQLAAYAVEAALIGFDGIPQLHERAEDVQARDDLRWVGSYVEGRLVALIAWERAGDVLDIDRLAVDPAAARQGHGRRLVRAVPRNLPTIVSTGTENDPAVGLYLSEGFVESGRTEVAPGIFTTQFHRPGKV